MAGELQFGHKQKASPIRAGPGCQMISIMNWHWPASTRRQLCGWFDAASQNALQRSVNSRGTPGRRPSRRIAGAGEIGTLSLPNDHKRPLISLFWIALCGPVQSKFDCLKALDQPR